jgi:methyl-accepting chemotaxis protein
MKIRTKVLLGFGSIFVLFLVLSFYNINTANKIKQTAQHVKDESAVFAGLAQQMKLDVVEVQQWLSDISATRAQDGLNDGFDEAEKSKQDFSEKLELFQQMYTKKNDADNLAALANIEKAMEAYHSQGVVMAKAYIDGGPAAGNKIMEAFDVAAEGINSLIDPFLKQQHTEHEEGMKLVAMMVDKMTTALLAGAVVMLLIIIASTVYLVISITKPINNVTEILKDISEGDGDLTIRLDDSGNDELAILAQYFNRFVSRLQNMFTDVVHGVQTLSSASTELSAISNQMSANSEQTTSKVDSVAAATEEMSATISEIASNTDKTKKITGTAVTQSENASNQINELGTAAQEVGKVTETITEISEQTNLLALNATIEAARAGEAGKGFAVVANEIKDLAKQTSDATGEIKDKISKIQDATKNSVTEITQITGVINEVNEMISNISVAVEEQANATQEISNNVSQASQGIQEVNENVAQTSSVTREVAADIAEVGQASGEINDNSSQVRVNAGELSELAENLTRLVSQFKV